LAKLAGQVGGAGEVFRACVDWVGLGGGWS